MIYRCIAPSWLLELRPDLRRVEEGEFSDDEFLDLNDLGYNIYFLPNFPSFYDSAKPVDGGDIDTFRYVFVDMDLKDGVYKDKNEFIQVLKGADILPPSFIVDSGNGVHAYWQVYDLDAISFLKLQRRLMRKFNTDEAVAKIYQLMRVPGTKNTKNKGEYKSCEVVETTDASYTCEQLDKWLPPLTRDDEAYCQQHYNKTYDLETSKLEEVDEAIPAKFGELLHTNKEVQEIWKGQSDDRSKDDWRLGHIMFASGFSRKNAMSVLVNTAKAMARAPKHRVNYAQNIVDKIWTYELGGGDDGDGETVAPLSSSVRDILRKSGNMIKGTRFPCWSYLDNTEYGFRLGQVVGLVAGSGVGKTAVALNMFMGFVRSNPDHYHFFIPLEQPANEIAERWRIMCGDQVHLHDKVHVMSNYSDDGSFRHLSLDDIKDYILKFQSENKCSVGCVVIDHIGALRKKGKNGENQDLMDICHAMKPFAVKTNTLLVMQSQAPREKAGIGDLELNKDAAYGTVYFESYCDYLITLWQPLKRCYGEGAPTVTAFKFCKIRHKNVLKDHIQEDVCYRLYFNPTTGKLCEMTQDLETSFDYFNKQATNKRKGDRKTDIVAYTSARWITEPHNTEGVPSGEVSNNTDSGAA